jgi:uncharacterized protein (DUF302 family)
MLKHALSTTLVLLMTGLGSLQAAGDSIVTRVLESDFLEVSSSVRSAILGKGINIAHVLPASDMLRRTGPAFGYKTQVFEDAETYEFCSAELSHKLARQSPDNIVQCPFTISVYTLVAEPGKVRITYKIPSGGKVAQAVTDEIAALLESIVEDAAW